MAVTSEGDPSASYSTSIGLVYVFNLIVGTGALTLPRAFHDAGYLLGLVVLSLFGFISYICVTFVVESMSCANAVITDQKEEVDIRSRSSTNQTDISETSDGSNRSDQPLLGDRSKPENPERFAIVKQVEISEMGALFFGRRGFYLFQIALVVYLFGDLSVYVALVPKSIMTVVCGNFSEMDGNKTISLLNYEKPCWENDQLSFFTHIVVYRIAVVCFMLVAGPFVFTGLTRTKYLQVFTTVSRWTAFFLMLVLALLRLLNGGVRANPPLINPAYFGSIMGVSVYAFMCHHSLPAVITPMKGKHRVHLATSAVYTAVLAFYVSLALSGVFAFADVEDVYTLSFKKDNTGADVALTLIDYFLALYPVFTISANFPVVGITLRNNLRSLLARTTSGTDKAIANGVGEALAEVQPVRDSTSADDVVIVPETPSSTLSSTTVQFASDYLIPLFVITPPFIVGFLTDDVEFLAQTTGSYGGVAVQFVLPAVLVLGARRHFVQQQHPHRSPFRHACWPYLILSWSLVTVVVVTANQIWTWVH